MSSGEPHGEGLCFAYLHEAIQIGPDARSSAQVQIERSDAEWKLTQILLDSD